MPPLLKKLRVVAVRHEATVGTAQSLTAADAAMNVFNPVMQPTVTMHDRENPSGFGSLASVPGQRYFTATFMTEVRGDGTGGVPFWASRLLPACGMVRTGNTFTVASGSPVGGSSDTSVRALTIGSYENGRLKLATGCMGAWKINFEASKHATIEWTFMGRYNDVVDAPILTGITRPTTKPIIFHGLDVTVGGSASSCLSTLSIESGNNVIVRPCASEIGGIESGLITNRKVTATLDPESKLIAEGNVFGDWLAGAESPFELRLEDGDDSITFAGPKFQRTNIQDAERNGIDVDQTTGQFNIDEGDDEFSITFGTDPTPETP